MTLVACSMDGKIMGFNFTPAELGAPMSLAEKSRIFKSLYGQTSGVTVADKPVITLPNLSE